MKIKNYIKRILFKSLLKVKSQSFWESLFQLSLQEMNFGNGGDFRTSGELFVAQWIQKKLEKELQIIVFDVGANVGDYSLALSNLFGDKAKIFSFEPARETFRLLNGAIKNYNNIFAQNIGFSDKDNNQLLYTNSKFSELASIYQRKLDHFGINMDKAEEIKLTTIDDYCDRNKIERIHFLKLDIEGHELNALNGAMKMIANNKINFIQFEFGGCNIDSKTYFQDFFYLLKNNYKIYRILKDNIYELQTYKEIYEIFITINYLAVRKVK